jgi:hypothetical protein
MISKAVPTYETEQFAKRLPMPGPSHPGGLYSVAYTDVVQLGCIFLGLVRDGSSSTDLSCSCSCSCNVLVLAACSLLVVNSYSKVHFRPLFCQLLRQDANVFSAFSSFYVILSAVTCKGAILSLIIKKDCVTKDDAIFPAVTIK